MNNFNEIKMYIVINDELNMTPGKIASQVGHVVQLIVDELVSNSYEEGLTANVINYEKWKLNPTKIILKASGNRFDRLLELPNSRHFIDTGKTTQGTKNKITAIGFFPGNLNDFFSDYDLVK
ncbi:peptidyl-tRNA hydrolase [Hokovirus HKV1]|uniref:peptidyl-tRNA hydrolase n=1 Tax=Hokovirus HKV1 TaxID=1977638 RepID=A0A1V0SEJ8_9VIRU|nr:peptidyl-tRNA hydrolase [Hokovirus HKV1]